MASAYGVETGWIPLPDGRGGDDGRGTSSSFFLDDQNTTNLLRDLGLGGLGLHGGSRESQDHREEQDARRAGDDHPRVPLHHLDKAAAVTSPSHATVAAALRFFSLSIPPSHVSPNGRSPLFQEMSDVERPGRDDRMETPGQECGPGGDPTDSGEREKRNGRRRHGG